MSWQRYYVFMGSLTVLAGLAFALRVRADEASAEETLKAQGLHKTSQCFALSDESVVSKKTHEIDLMRKKVLQAQKLAAAADTKADDKKKLMTTYAQKRRELRAQFESAKSMDVRNRCATLLNELADRMTIMAESDKEEKEATAARAAAAEVSEQYIGLLLQIRKQYDEVEEKYEKLGADPKVQQALEEFNKDGSKQYKLGPTGSFALLDRSLKKLEAAVLSETITMHRGGGDLWHVTVTFNGSHAQDIGV